MSKTKLSAIFILAITLVVPRVSGVNAQTSATQEPKEIYSFAFDDEAEQGEYFTGSASIGIEWVFGADMGHGDDNALKITHTEGTDYNSYNNAVRLTFPEPLSVGKVYRVSAWFYAPSEGNEGKKTLTGPGIVLNGDYAGAQGVSKFPTDFGSLPLDEWKGIDVTLPALDSPVDFFDIRIVVNDAPFHPDVWYMDNIEILQVGEASEEAKTPEWDLSLPSLRTVFSDYFLVGNIMEPAQTSVSETTTMFTHHYNIVTPENSMKPSYMARAKGQYNYSGADTFVDWAEKNGLLVHGHTLVWHSQSADWLTKDEDGQPLTRKEAKANMEEYINAVAGHYSGRIHSWDVVNEAFTTSVGGVPSDWRTALRALSGGSEASSWYAAYENGADESKGEHASDYIYDAFVFARLADPNALLYYNDFNETYQGKREVIASMTEELNERWKSDGRNTEPNRLLIEGIGMQAHYWTSNLRAEEVEDTIVRFAKTGAIISVSELDIPLGSWSKYGEPTEAQLRRQADLYKQVFEVYLKYADNIERVTFWGKADPQSWRGQGYPLLFDKYFSAKDSFWAVVGTAGVSEGDVVTPDPLTPFESTDNGNGSESPDNGGSEPPGDDGDGGGGNAVWIVMAVVAVSAGALSMFFINKARK
ncbi:MAG: endo-1,4-beta-xylanase [Oscillospiraceae bacterium]|jgi:GH35 family endo-1,4-beta-xylanase|nr:endo-1,4-beta-xylanase [Oscillospiraceae bacterium]